jgi:small-conductance mechanosensitive channel
MVRSDLFHDFNEVTLFAVYAAVATVGGVVVRTVTRRWIDRLGPKIDANLHRIFAHNLPRPAGFAFFLFTMRFAPLPAQVEGKTQHLLPFVFGMLAVVVLMRLVMTAISAYGESNPQLKSTAGIGRAITWILGLAMIAVLVSDALGVSLAPALTALGVGSLSVALALQDTLSNFFSGIYLLLDKPIRPGDFVHLDGGQEGYVETIGWRSTHLRTLVPSAIIVPNATLSKSIITNFRGSNPRLLLGTVIEVSLDSDPRAVADLMEQEAATALDIAGTDPKQKPFVRFAVGDRGLAFTLYAQILPTTDGSLVQQEIRKRAIARLRAAGVKLAEPNPFVKR